MTLQSVSTITAPTPVCARCLGRALARGERRRSTRAAEVALCSACGQRHTSLVSVPVPR